MKAKRKRNNEPVVNRRAVLQSLALGLGAIGLGRAIFACDDGQPPPATRETTGSGVPPTDGDEYVPGTSTPVNAGDAPPVIPNQSWEARVKQLESEQARLFRPEVFTEISPGQWAGKERSHVPTATNLTENGAKKIVVIVQHVMGLNGLDAGPTPPAPEAGPGGGDGGGKGDGGGNGGGGGGGGGNKDAGKDASGDASTDGGISDASTTVDAAKDTGSPVVPPVDAATYDAAGAVIHYITTIYLRAVVNGTDTVVGLWEFESTDPAPPSVKFTLPAGVDTIVAFEWCTLHGLWSSTPLKVV